MGCVGEISGCFSVLQKKGLTAAFSRIYRPGGTRGGVGVGGGVGGRGEGREAVKSRSSAGQINSNQLHRTGDGIAPLKIQEGRNINVTVVSADAGSLAAARALAVPASIRIRVTALVSVLTDTLDLN